MKPRTTSILYWSVTILFCLANLGSGIGGLFPNEEGAAVIALLGYPAYFMMMLSIAKILGAIAIIQTKFVAVKEWAYAGFTFDYVAAALSFYIVNGDFVGMLVPAVFLAVLSASYFLWKARMAQR